jgi:hypothetical protein
MTIVWVPLLYMKWLGFILFLLALLGLIFGTPPDGAGDDEAEWWGNGLRWFSWPLFFIWFFWIFIRGLVN